MKTMVLLFALYGAAVVARPQASPAAKGRETFERVCSTCHRPESAIAARRSRDRWQESIEGMIQRGAKIGDDDFTIILDTAGSM